MCCCSVARRLSAAMADGSRFRQTARAAVLVLSSLAVSLAPAGLRAQTPFLEETFDAGDLGDFLSPVVDFSACGTVLPPSGEAVVENGEVVITNDATFGISIVVLHPDAVQDVFPESRNYSLRCRFQLETASEFSIGLKCRLGVDPTGDVIFSQFERSYTVAVFPENADPEFLGGVLSIFEFQACHGQIDHPEWPNAGGGFARFGFDAVDNPIVQGSWYWLEASVLGNEDGGPVTISAKLWPEAEDPPDAPQLVVVDEDGLDLDAETRDPAREPQVVFGVSLDFPTGDLRDPGAVARLDDVTLVSLDPGGDAAPRFRRGDVDGLGSVDLTDAIRTLNFLFLGGSAPDCFDAADADDSGRLELTDAILTLNVLFLGTGQIPPPGINDCGEDVAADDLAKCVYDAC